MGGTRLIAAGVCAATALISFILPGRTADGGRAQRGGERKELEEIMEEEAELAGAGLVLAEAQIGATDGREPHGGYCC
jgi:hypothetical protein